ncbi:MAG TPA: hypothetical protein VLL48_04640 [Longimicrobiales bacterium]|nr:hypothetical protein [Longimicrobiales bacterium]
MKLTRPVLIVPLLLSLALGACATGGAAGGGGNPDVLTAEDLEGVRASNVLEAIQQLWPRWLRSRDAREPIRVIVNNTPRGDLDELRQISLPNVAEIRYRDGRDATTRYGIGYGAGAIEVTTR